MATVTSIQGRIQYPNGTVLSLRPGYKYEAGPVRVKSGGSRYGTPPKDGLIVINSEYDIRHQQFRYVVEDEDGYWYVGAGEVFEPYRPNPHNLLPEDLFTPEELATAREIIGDAEETT